MLRQLSEGVRMLARARRVARKGVRRHKGSAEQICRQVVKHCFNGRYFQTSTGHFSGFYVRDFAYSLQALKSLGYEEEAYKTIEYALAVFSRHSRITTTITPEGQPVDIFSYAPDSLPLLLYSIRLGASELAEVYRPFLEQQSIAYYEKVYDAETGLVRHGAFSSIKDHHVRESSCYDNCMLGLARSELSALKLPNPFARQDIAGRIRKAFWNSRYFFDDMKRKDYVAGDANVFPFWCGLFTDREMASEAIASVIDAGLDRPFPLKYTVDKPGSRVIFPMNLLAPDYELDSVWPHLGLCYLDIVARFRKELLKRYLKQYRHVIEKHGNMLEVFFPDGRPYRKPYYAADEGMIWAAKFLALNI